MAPFLDCVPTLHYSNIRLIHKWCLLLRALKSILCMILFYIKTIYIGKLFWFSLPHTVLSLGGWRTISWLEWELYLKHLGLPSKPLPCGSFSLHTLWGNNYSCHWPRALISGQIIHDRKQMSPKVFGTRPIQGFPWGPNVWRSVVPCLKPGIIVAEPVMVWDQGSWGAVASHPENLSLSSPGLWVSVLWPLWWTLDNLCSLVQYCLISLLLTLSHYMTAFSWLCFIFPLQTVYKTLNFLTNMFGIRHSLHKTFLTLIFLYFYSLYI